MRKLLKRILVSLIIVLVLSQTLVNCAAVNSVKASLSTKNSWKFELLESMLKNFSQDSVTASKQIVVLNGKSKETNPPNFIRLVFMRLIYGIASTMGLEERLEDAFNGAFVPPNAGNDDVFGFGDDNDSGVGGLFDDDY